MPVVNRKKTSPRNGVSEFEYRILEMCSFDNCSIVESSEKPIVEMTSCTCKNDQIEMEFIYRPPFPIEYRLYRI